MQYSGKSTSVRFTSRFRQLIHAIILHKIQGSDVASKTEIQKTEMSGPATALLHSLELEKMEILNLPMVAKLEKESYPDDEAASALTLEYRIVTAGHLCYVAFKKGTRDIVGFIVGTGAPDGTKQMTEEMMRDHYSPGNVLCIHSVVIRQENRRKGLGTEMMTAYLRKIAENTHMTRILLISKQRLVPFYDRLGFKTIGESSISHGKETWIEMTRTLS